MKTLIVIGLLLSASNILLADDQNAQSFATGMAQGLNNALQAQRGYYPQTYVNPDTGMSQAQLEQWAIQQQMLRNQQDQIQLQRQQLQETQNQNAWWNK